MFHLQQFCPMVHKHTPVEDRNDNTGWITLLSHVDRDNLQKIMDRPYHDGKERNERIIETLPVY